MKVLIVAIGSRGDVAPCVGLGHRLRAAGHDVAVAAHDPFRELVTGAGLEFRSIPGDVHALNDELIVAPKLTDRRSRPSLRRRREVAESYWRQVADGTLAAATQGADVLLLGFTAWLPGRQVAEALDLPCLGVNVYPVHPTADHAPISLSTTRSFGRLGNRIAGHLTNWTVAQAMVLKQANGELRSRLGLPPASVTAVCRQLETDQWPIYLGVSPTLLPPPADWRAGVHVPGFWWPPESDRQPPSDLVDFLAAGPPPVFVGFGSTAHGRDGATAATFVAALRGAGMRGVIQADWDGVADLGDDMITVGEVSYDWLFPQLAAVVHQGSIGTVGCGMRAGTPTVTVPLFHDQPLWGSRLVALGVSPAAIPFRQLTTDKLTDAIRAAVSERSYRDNARRVAERVRAEDGAGPVVEAIGRLSEAARFLPTPDVRRP
jgi:sterol 3beta-glucosyltransferase